MEKRIIICLILTLFIIAVLSILYILYTKDKYENTITLFGESINNNNMAPAPINNIVLSMGPERTTPSMGPGRTTPSMFGESINNNNMAPAPINNIVLSMGPGRTTPSMGPGRTTTSLGPGRTTPSMGTGRTTPSTGPGRTTPSMGPGRTTPSTGPGRTTPSTGPGRNWCENLGGKLKEGQCVFPSWDDCVKGLQCKIDPSEVHLGWYNADKSKNYDDVAQAMINGEMEIVDVCHPVNTSWNSNPRCKIKNGVYKGKTGVCVYDGEQVQPCQAVGQGCTAKLDEFCPGHYGDPFSGNVVLQHLMCRKTRNKNGEQEVSAVCAY